MDLPDEELKQPLVETQPSGPPPVPSRSPQHGRGGGGAAASPKRGSQDIARGAPPNSLLNAINNQKMATNNYVAMRNPPNTRGEEEKESDGVGGLLRPENIKQQLPYAAPNVHPYAVPQYQSNVYGDSGGGNGGWGASHEQSYDDERGSNIDLAVSGMYTLAAAFTVIQGFGMLIHFTPGAIALGFYTMAFGALVILYDLKSVVNGVSVEMYFPFLGNYIGRALTILFFAVLCAQTYEYGGWTKLIVLYNLVVATLQGFVYFTTKTVSPVQPHMEDLPDL